MIYINDRKIYQQITGRLFADTTAQRFVFYFFCRPTFFKKIILASRTNGTFCYAEHTSQSFANKSFFLPKHQNP